MGDDPIQKGISSFQDSDFASTEAERLGLALTDALTICLVPGSSFFLYSLAVKPRVSEVTEHGVSILGSLSGAKRCSQDESVDSKAYEHGRAGAAS